MPLGAFGELRMAAVTGMCNYVVFGRLAEWLILPVSREAGLEGCENECLPGGRGDQSRFPSHLDQKTPTVFLSQTVSMPG